MQAVVYDTYKQAAIQRGLLEDATEWHRCLEEANFHASAAQLREVFASIFIHNVPVDPAALCDAFRGPMTEDILHRLRQVNPLQAASSFVLLGCIPSSRHRSPFI